MWFLKRNDQPRVLLEDFSDQDEKTWQRKREEVFLQLCKAEGEGFGQHKRLSLPHLLLLVPVCIFWFWLGSFDPSVLVGWLWTCWGVTKLLLGCGKTREKWEGAVSL